MNVPELPPEIIQEILVFRRKIMYQEFLFRNLNFHIERHCYFAKQHCTVFTPVLLDLVSSTNSLRHFLDEEFCKPVNPLTQVCKRLLEKHVPGYSNKRFRVANTSFTVLERHGKVKSNDLGNRIGVVINDE
jgi:hypothetical protein